MQQELTRFLDDTGRLTKLPSKQRLRQYAYAYLAEKFEADSTYTEREVNAILNAWHTFGDYFILRRGLIDGEFLQRLPDGSKYWKNKNLQENT